MFFLIEFLIFAQTQTPAKGPSLPEMLIMPAAFLGIMYFFMIRPNQKKAKEQANLLSSIKAGDEVVTASGIIGKVKTIQDAVVSLEISHNVHMKILKSTISHLRTVEAEPAKN